MDKLSSNIKGMNFMKKNFKANLKENLNQSEWNINDVLTAIEVSDSKDIYGKSDKIKSKINLNCIRRIKAKKVSVTTETEVNFKDYINSRKKKK